MIVSGKVSLVKTAVELRWRLLTVGLVALAVNVVHDVWHYKGIAIQITPITALGVAIGLFLGFRCNVVWSRYWEARTLWGRLINASRTFARQCSIYLADEATYRQLCLALVVYVKVFKAHLRDESLDEYRVLVAEEIGSDFPTNLPASLLHRLGQKLKGQWQSGNLTEFHLVQLDNTLTEITTILGGCERIKNTPIPPAFTYVSHRIMQAYVCLLPFGMVADLEWFTAPVAIGIAFAFLTLDQISDLIEQPFATEDNDLPLAAMTRTIEIDILERLGDVDAPAPLKPVEGVLL